MSFLKKLFCYFCCFVFALLLFAGAMIYFISPEKFPPARIARFMYYQRLSERFMSIFWENFFTSEILYTGEVVYAGTVSGIEVFDARDGKKLAHVKNIRLYGRVGHLSREGNILYVTSGATGFFTLDISSPLEPRIIGKLNLFHDYYVDDGAVKNGMVYLSTQEGLVIVNAKDPSEPRIVGTIKAKFFKWVHLSGDKLYLAHAGKGLLIFDLKNPARPVLLSKLNVYKQPEKTPLPVDPPPRWVLNVGDYVYLANGYQGVSVINVKNPKKPLLVRHVKAGIFSDQISIVGSYLAVRALPNTLTFLDISKPDFPKPVKTMPGLGFTRAGFHGTKAVFMTHISGFHIADIREPLSPKVLSSHAKKPVCWDVKIHGDVLYVANGDEGLKIYNVASPEKPVLLSSIMTTGFAMRVLVRYPYVFVANGISGVDIINVRNPKHPAYVTSFNFEQRSWGISQNKNIIYVAGGSMGLTLFDVKNPARPVYLAGKTDHVAYDEFLKHDYYFNVSAAHPFVFLMGFLGNVGITNIKQKGTYHITPFWDAAPHTCDVKQKGNIFYFGYNGGIQIVRLEKNGILNPAGKRRTRGLVLGLTIEGNQLYAADYKKGVLVYDIQDPSSPRETAHYATKGTPRNIAVKGNIAYVADGEAGLTVINLATGQVL